MIDVDERICDLVTAIEQGDAFEDLQEISEKLSAMTEGSYEWVCANCGKQEKLTDDEFTDQGWFCIRLTFNKLFGGYIRLSLCGNCNTDDGAHERIQTLCQAIRRGTKPKGEVPA